MNPCSQKLKEAREKLALSLEDISTSTKINVKFLQAIEDGKFDFLDDVYVRAFIRSYAKAVGLDPEECIKKYEEAIAPPEVVTKPETTQSPLETTQKVRLPKSKGVDQKTILILISIVIIIALVMLLNLFKSEPLGTEMEVPFQDAVKKVEQQTLQSDSVKQLDSLTTSILSEKDSLILFITTSESSWISVLIDDKYKNEILLMPEKNIIFKAADNFKLTTGNAGALKIKLNNKSITQLGKRGEVVRDFLLSRKNLE